MKLLNRGLLGILKHKMIKKIGKSVLCLILEAQVKRLRKNNDFKIVAVCGSVGKTTTKMAIAKMLGSKSRVCYEEGNYNDRLTVPLVLFGEREPSIFDIKAWLRLLRRTGSLSRQNYPYEYAVLELGSDAPGQLASFKYLNPEIVVLTAISMEHMEYFGDMEHVAYEELTPLYFAQKRIVNVDDVSPAYLEGHQYLGYGFNAQLGYRIEKGENNQITVQLDGQGSVSFKNPMLGEQGAKAVAAAVAAGHQLGWDALSIRHGIEYIGQVAGRMQILEGLNESTLIDDTYNASPLAVNSALDVLYSFEAPSRIAILGSMNELGGSSKEAHEEVAHHINPDKLAYVVTIGSDANNYIAPLIERAGCEVVKFTSPYEAGTYVKDNLPKGSVVLAKGSQNGVFAEEALKQLLLYPVQANKLVRQSPEWLEKKRLQFTEV